VETSWLVINALFGLSPGGVAVFPLADRREPYGKRRARTTAPRAYALYAFDVSLYRVPGAVGVGRMIYSNLFR
jgi:hypothetical protein